MTYETCLQLALGDNDFKSYRCVLTVDGSTIVDQFRNKRVVVSNPTAGCIWLRDIALLSIEGLLEWLKRHVEAHYQVEDVFIFLEETL